MENTIQEALKKRIAEIVCGEQAKRTDGKWRVCQTGIRHDENGNFVLILSLQSQADWENIISYKEVVL